MLLIPGIGIPLRWEEYNRPMKFNAGWIRVVIGGVALLVVVFGLIGAAIKLLPSPAPETAEILTKLFMGAFWFAWMISLRRDWKKLDQRSQELQPTSMVL